MKPPIPNGEYAAAQRFDAHDVGFLSGYVVAVMEAHPGNFSGMKAWAGIGEWLYCHPTATPDELKVELKAIVWDAQELP